MLKQIKLKYHKGKTPKDPNAKCYICKKRNIAVGSMYKEENGRLRFFCESCTIDIYQEDHGFKLRKEAAARRRRMFDVPYFFSETVLDKYMIENGIRDYKLIPKEDFEFLIQGANDLYNRHFSKEDKERLEVMDQGDIESVFKELLAKMDRYK